MRIFHTIVELLRFKTSTSYTEIASVAGLKKIEVLQVLNKNVHLIRKSRNDKIIGLRVASCGVLYESKHNSMMFNDLISHQWKE